jgi:hypothetical protein
MTEQREDGKAGYYGHQYEHNIALRKRNHRVRVLPTWLRLPNYPPA